MGAWISALFGWGPHPTQQPATAAPLAATATPYAATAAPPAATAAPATRDPFLPTLWTSTQFQGQYKQLAPGTYTSLAAAGFPNSYLRSIQVPANRTVILYAGNNLQGRSLYASSDLPDLGDFNGLASSAVVVAGPVVGQATAPPATASPPTPAATVPPFTSRPICWHSDAGWSMFLSCGLKSQCSAYGGVALVDTRNDLPTQLWSYTDNAIYNGGRLPLAVRAGGAMSTLTSDLPGTPGQGLYEWRFVAYKQGYQIVNPKTGLCADVYANKSSPSYLTIVMVDPSKATGYWEVQ